MSDKIMSDKINRDFNRANNCGISAPCKDCPNRSPVCDKSCLKYQFYKFKISKLREEYKNKMIERENHHEDR